MNAVEADRALFPHEALIGCKTALVLFCAAFGGTQDARWIAEASLAATCVDTDQDKLDAMWMHYPDSWEFVCMDAYEFARMSERQWDVVTLDPWTNLIDDCADNIGAWCRLARSAVVLTTGVATSVTAPAGWRIASVRRRSSYDGGIYWTTLERV